MKYASLLIRFIMALILFSLFSTSFALPFTIVPAASLPTSVPLNGAITATYTVTNNTSSTHNNNYVKWLPPNVTAGATGCTSSGTFNLTAGGSCTLTLVITDAVNAYDPDPHHHLFICFTGGTTCAGVSLANSLNVSVGTAALYTAVGAFNNDTLNLPLSYYSANMGNNWTLSSTLPPQQNSPTGANVLNGVACSSSGLICAAVGYYFNGTNNAPVSFYSTNGGVTWSVSTTLPPANSANDNELNSIACSSSGLLCTAVGFYNNGDADVPLSYYTTDGGNNWSISTTLPPTESGDDNALYGVACSSSGLTCAAIGYYNNDEANLPESYYSTDGGQNWFASVTPPPQQYSTDSDNQIYTIACSSSGLTCTTLGYYNNGTADVPLSYYSSDGGQNWTVSTTLPLQQNAPDGSNEILGVACNSTGLLCSAVGYYLNGDAVSIPSAFTTSDGGVNWSVSTTPPPQQGGVNANNTLTSITSDRSGLLCSAVGYGDDGFGGETPLAFNSVDGGNTWTAASMQPPEQTVGQNNVLNAIAGKK